ncbi:hypothetical protein M8369_41930, partial [Klebsiella pneumoniae]|nr:hypothetical protein [Klebsiella pneumoniae]
AAGRRGGYLMWIDGAWWRIVGQCARSRPAAMFLKKGSCRGEGYPPLTSWLSLCYDWVLAR